MIEKILALIAAARSGDWKTALKITLGLIQEGVDLLEAPTCAAETDDPLMALEAVAKDPAAQANGELLKNVLPFLLAILKKYLGL